MLKALNEYKGGLFLVRLALLYIIWLDIVSLASYLVSPPTLRAVT